MNVQRNVSYDAVSLIEISNLSMSICLIVLSIDEWCRLVTKRESQHDMLVI